MKKIVLYFLSPLLSLVNYFLSKKQLFVIYRFGTSIGDQLCITAVAREYYIQRNFKVVVITPYPELFYNNCYVYKVIDMSNSSVYIRRLISSILDGVDSNYIENFRAKTNSGESFEEFMRKSKTDMHLIQLHSLHFKIRCDLECAAPNIFFTSNELNLYRDAFPLSGDYSVVQPVGKVTYTQNKEWGFDRYQKVINKTKHRIKWVQVGFETDKLLEGVIDYRGRTSSIRELAYVVKKSNFILSNEGLLNHVAASVNTDSVVIFSGFSVTGQSSPFFPKT